jgi:hypothetical protein
MIIATIAALIGTADGMPGKAIAVKRAGGTAVGATIVAITGSLTGITTAATIVSDVIIRPIGTTVIGVGTSVFIWDPLFTDHAI